MKYSIRWHPDGKTPDALVEAETGRAIALFTWLCDRATAERIEFALERYGADEA